VTRAYAYLEGKTSEVEDHHRSRIIIAAQPLPRYHRFRYFLCVGLQVRLTSSLDVNTIALTHQR
jgi:hypothetical protein